MMALRAYFPLIVIVATFVWACASIAMRRTDEAPAGVTEIRIGHWQLEAGVREALDVLGAEFSNLPEIRAKYGRVRVVQDAIPESTYGQWVSTQMLAGTAPDLIEVGKGLPHPIWLAYQNRYFVPLSNLVDSPNPFNKGTPLEGISLKNTISDGMRSGYLPEMQQYMSLSLARLTSRVFYNRDLLKRLTGIEKPSGDYRAFIGLCRKIGAARDEQGEYYTPIASSQYHDSAWQGNLCDPLTYSLLFKVDYNRDGAVGNDETFVGFRRGILSFMTPAIRAKFLAARELQQECQPGFTGLSRDEAVFLFAQQRAVFISSGIWEASGLFEQAKGQFTVGVMGFPQPTRDDAEYGSLILGPNFDPTFQGVPFGLTRFSGNPELARDFLLYLVSRDGNRKFNDIVGWIPSVVGVPLPLLLQDFKPDNQGMYASLDLQIGPNTQVKYLQCYSRYQNDPSYTYDDFTKDFAPIYARQGLADWEEQQRDWRRTVATDERIVASIRGRAILAGSKQDEPDWNQYRQYVTDRLIFPDIVHANQQRMVYQVPANARGPYDYQSAAFERIRAEVKQSLARQRAVAMGGQR